MRFMRFMGFMGFDRFIGVHLNVRCGPRTLRVEPQRSAMRTLTLR